MELCIIQVSVFGDFKGGSMKLKNILIVVKDIEKSKQFYHDLFGLDMVLDNDGNMILTEGLVLQEEKIWKKFLEKEIISESNSCELYFEEREIEKFVQKLEKLYPSIQYVNRLTVSYTHLSDDKYRQIASDLSKGKWEHGELRK